MPIELVGGDMRDFIAGIEQFLSRIPGSKSPAAILERIPDSQCTPAESSGKVIDRDSYFALRVNQLVLAEDVEWYVKYDPMVVVIFSFNYGAQRLMVPCVIGPDFIRNQFKTAPPRYGTILTDICVAGPHPYRGGGIDLSLCFYKVRRVNYAESLLKVAEGLSQSLLAGQFGTWIGAGGTLLDALSGLLGLDETVYIAGYRTSLGHHIYPLTSAYFCLTTPSAGLQLPSCLVQNGRLFQDSGAGAITPYQGSDFVLLSVEGYKRRDDTDRFPFFASKKEALSALFNKDDGYQRAKGGLGSAYEQLRKSADFTEGDIACTFKEWMADFQKLKREAELLHKLSAAEDKDEPVSEVYSVDNFIRQLSL